MKMRKTRLYYYLSCLSLFLSLSGCAPTQQAVPDSNHATALGANGLVAPAAYVPRARPPRSMGHPTTAALSMPVTPQARLPEISAIHAQRASPWQGVQNPLVQGLNPDLATRRPLPVQGLNPKQPMPIKQQIYGGAYGNPAEKRPYKYMAGDVLAVQIKNQPELSGEVTVAADGKIQLPGAPDFITAAGLDNEQISRAIAAVARPYVRQAPVVRVTAKNVQGGYYSIFGGVKNPGRFAIGARPITLAEAVFRADSAPPENAAALDTKSRERFAAPYKGWLGEVVLVTPHRTFPQAKKYNVAAALYGGQGQQNPLVRPGQIIIVPDPENPQLQAHLATLLELDNQQRLLALPNYATAAKETPPEPAPERPQPKTIAGAGMAMVLHLLDIVFSSL